MRRLPLLLPCAPPLAFNVRLVLALALASHTLSCGDAASPIGAVVRVRIVTEGVDPDNTYQILTDAQAPIDAGPVSTTTIHVSGSGTRRVELRGIATNCKAITPRSVLVSPRNGRIVDVRFRVHCSARTGGLVIVASTIGEPSDPDGYEVLVDDEYRGTISANGELSVPDVTSGTRKVRLIRVADGCSGGQEQLVLVPDAQTANVAFSIVCTIQSGSVRVSTSSSGVEVDTDGYLVHYLNESRALPANGSVVLQPMPVGLVVIVLSGVARNCVVPGGQSRTFNVSSGQTTDVNFVVTCAPNSASLVVTTSTTGTNPDANGFVALFGNNEYPAQLPANGTTTFSLSLETHNIFLTQVAPNCNVLGGTSRTFSLTQSAAATVSFSVVCGAAGSIRVSVETVGPSPDLDGYRVTLNQSTESNFIGLAPIVIKGAPVGEQQIFLAGIASNCVTSTPNPASLNVSANTEASVHFIVQCL